MLNVWALLTSNNFNKFFLDTIHLIKLELKNPFLDS